MTDAPRTLTPTQVKRPWRATARTVFQALVGGAAIAPQVYEAATHHDPAAATGWAGLGLAVSAGITRVMALPGVNNWLAKYVPFLAAAPKQILGKALVANPSDSEPAQG